jgi:uncharacterized membrane protein YphA (DoxX/SURF4 family)
MNAWTKSLLVLLRLVIGWHLLFAGLAKFAPDYRGSEGYLQEASGPLAPFFHAMVGDKVADRYAVAPGDGTGAERCPAALAKEWGDYTDQFIAHYHLDANQQDLCRAALEDNKAKTVDWILNGSQPRKLTSPWASTVAADRTPQQRVAEYVSKREQIRKAQAGEEFFVSFHTAFAADKTKDLLGEKADVARNRAELAKAMDDRTKSFQESLRNVLTPQQAQEYGPMPEPTKAGWFAMSRLDWIDFLVRWGLVISGAGLILGLFSRSSCVLGALLLLSFYLAQMPLPGVIEAVRVEGYPYINKNIVEMLALLTLATTASGRWAGLDVFIYNLNPFRRRTATPKGPPPPPDRNNGPRVNRPVPVAAPSHIPSRR